MPTTRRYLDREACCLQTTTSGRTGCTIATVECLRSLLHGARRISSSSPRPLALSYPGIIKEDGSIDRGGKTFR